MGLSEIITHDDCSDELGTALLYDGSPITLEQGGGAWVPVVTARGCEAPDSETFVVMPSTDSPVDVVPGIWGTEELQGMICVI